MKKSRMFEGLRTWNPQFGCNFHCYRDGCWAKKKLAHRLGTMLNCQLCYDFKPHFHRERLWRIPSNPKIFVVAHGDLFGNWVPANVIEDILRVCRAKPKEMWFFETKNPERYLDFIDLFPENTMLSTTIETNRVYPPEIRGRTPEPFERVKAIAKASVLYPVHIAIEPILDFDLDILLKWMKVIRPKKVSVGYDSLKNCLPEPSIGKTLQLINALTKFTDVERKDLRGKSPTFFGVM